MSQTILHFVFHMEYVIDKYVDDEKISAVI